MSAASVSLTDEVIREVGEQISQALSRKLPKYRGVPFDISRGIELYQVYLGDPEPSKEVSLSQAIQYKPSEGGAPKEAGVYVVRHEGRIKYVGRSTENVRERLKQHESGGSTANKNIAESSSQVTVQVISTGSKEATKEYEAKLIKEHNPDWNKREEKMDRTRIMKDASIRMTGNLLYGALYDVALIAFGGAVLEIREAYKNPHSMTLAERCERFLRTILEKIKVAFRDRALREIGSEVILGMVTVLAAPIRMATTAIQKIYIVLRRLWMDFVNGRIKTVADVVSAALKSVFVIASVGVAFALEQWLSPTMAAIPGGDILAAIIAAALAGVMIVVGNRSIEAVVQSLASIFGEGAAARLRREEIQRKCDELIPQLIEDRNRLERLVEANFAKQDKILRLSFAQLQTSQILGDIDGFLQELVKINAVYGSSLPWRNFQQFDQEMQDRDKPLPL